jgi:hypothetical protein
MLTSYEREVAITLIEALVDYGMGEHLESYGKRSLRDWYEDNGLAYAGYSMSSGCTKACIMHNDLVDWVIKVGFVDGKLDYAALEYENYCLAEEAGLNIYFPETVYIGEFCGRAFYAQRMCECDEDQISSEWFECLRDRYEECGEEYDSDSIWSEVDNLDDIEKVELFFGNEELIDFLRERRINDLHEGNFGYRGGCKVIIDFGGYRGW